MSQAGEAQGGVRATLCNASGQVMQNKTAPDGVVRFEGLDDATYTLTLQLVDSAAWTVASHEPLPPDRAASTVAAQWTADGGDAGNATQCVAGETDDIYSIAFAAGLLPDAVWAANESLHASREEWLLVPGETITLPARALRWEDVLAGNRYRLELQGRATVFLADLFADDEPRTQLTCLVDVDGELTTLSTDADGILEVPISPDSLNVSITVDDRETVQVLLGELLPVATTGGVERRLYNLGYLLELPDADSPEAAIALRAAIRWFQRDMALDDTGELTADDLAMLEALHGS